MAERQPIAYPISWFWDFYNRKMLEMNPPYQRRSVWPPKYREDFIDTILLNYPSPAIFLYENITETGTTDYAVIDGKQRLSTIFSFANNEFPVGEKCPFTELRGLYFENLSKEQKISFFKYKLSTEILPTADAGILDAIFERLNKNTKRLTAQELRHAKFDGVFIHAVEEHSKWMTYQLGGQLPNISSSSRNQMKDDEIVATLLLFLEEGPKGYSTEQLDAAFSNRDESWDREPEISAEFRASILEIFKITQHPDGQFITGSRFKNQADFYSLFAAISEMKRKNDLPETGTMSVRLGKFLEMLDDDPVKWPGEAGEYVEAARAASNDIGPRKTRISVITKVILGIQLNGRK